MITVPLVTEYHVCTPVLFRYLPSVHVEAFFNDGSLRLSSFRRFALHEDEQRLDRHEGRFMLVHKTLQSGGQTVMVNGSVGQNAYVLCGAMRRDPELLRKFGGAYIRINDTTKFGMAVAKHIPGLTGAFEGPCLYQDKKIIERDLGYIDPNQFRDPSDPRQLNKAMMQEFVGSQMQHYPFFLKDSFFAHQVEYRYLWLSSVCTPDLLDIKVPEAIQFCSGPSPLTE